MRLGVVLPVFNDWASVATVTGLLQEHVTQNPTVSDIQVFVIDDGSTEPASSRDQMNISHSKAHVLRLQRNVGHQRAIAAGIHHALSDEVDFVLVMDADGEDPPELVNSLVDRAVANPESVVVAKRGLRSENLSFRALYRAHKFLFRLLVGERLDFGNFVVMPRRAAETLSKMPETSSHFPAALLKSRLPILRVTVDRGKRFFGSSKMSLEKLISHSFASLSIFTERIMVRLVVFSFFATVLSGLAALAVLFIRLFSDLATPGWATVASGLLILFSLQVLSFAGLGTLITLNVSTLRDFVRADTMAPELPLETSSWQIGGSEGPRTKVAEPKVAK